MSEGQDEMIQMKGRNHIYFCFTEVRMDVLVLWVGDDDGMTNGILLCLVNPRVQGDSRPRI